MELGQLLKRCQMEKFDDVWNSVPHFSLYQFKITAFAGLISLCGGLAALYPVFGQWTPPFHCQSDLDSTFRKNLSNHELAALHESICYSMDKCQTCDFSVPDTCQSLTAFEDISKCLASQDVFYTNETYGCQHYVYDMEAIGQPEDAENLIFHKGGHKWETTVTSFDTVCDRSWLNSLMTSMGLIGMWFGALMCGTYCDRFGRKNAIMVFSFLFAVFSMLQSIIYSEYAFIVFRMLSMCTCHIGYIAALTYGLEVTGPSKRSIPGSMVNVYFAFGYSGISALAYFVPDWRGISLAIAFIVVIQIFLGIFIPESPRFLVIKGRAEEAAEILKTISNKSGLQLHDGFVDELKDMQKVEVEESKQLYSILTLFKTRPMRWVTLNLGFTFMVTTVIYYGLAYNVSSLSGNIYVNNAVNGIVECVSYFFCIPLIDRFGRKPVTIIWMYIGSAACLGFMLINEFGESTAAGEVGKWLAFVGKFCISGAFNNVFIFAAELYPTEIRTVGVGFVSMVGRVSGALAPFIIAIQDVDGFGWLPYTLFAILGVLSSTWMMVLPETNNISLLQTIKEADDFYTSKKRRIFKN